MLKRLVFYCCLAQLNIFITGTESGTEILPDTTPITTVSATSTIISSEATYPTTTPFQCVYDGKVYNVGDTFIANNHCDICWCLSSQLICTMCPPQPSTSTTSSTISSEPTSTTTSATSTTTSPKTATTTTAWQCVYNGQVYNEGDTFIITDYCQHYCWCKDSHLICTMCPPQTSTSTTSSTISSEPNTTTSSTPSTTISSEPTMTTTAWQCVYNGQVYNEGDTFIITDYCQHYCWCKDSHLICTMCPPQTSTSTTSSTISSEPNTTTSSTPINTISSEPTTTTTAASAISRLPTTTSSSTYTEKKRRRPTLPPAAYTKTKKIHTNRFDNVTKKPQFTIRYPNKLGSKRSTIPKGNRRNVDIR